MDQNHVTRKMEARLMTRASQAQEHTLPVQLPGILLGVGLGGFFDGILGSLHQTSKVAR